MSDPANARNSTSPIVPFSTSPDPAFYVDTADRNLEKLTQVIGTSSGGVYGITGVRGAGKSVLLKKVLLHFKEEHHTIEVSAPISSLNEGEFFVMMFRQLCDSILSRLPKPLLDRPQDLRGIVKWERLRQRSIQVVAYGTLILLLAMIGFKSWHYIEFKGQKKEIVYNIEQLVRVHFDWIDNTFVEKAEDRAKVRAFVENNKSKEEVHHIFEKTEAELAFLETLVEREKRYPGMLGNEAASAEARPHPAVVELNRIREKFSIEPPRSANNLVQPGPEIAGAPVQVADLTKFELLREFVAAGLSWGPIHQRIVEKIGHRQMKLDELRSQYAQFVGVDVDREAELDAQELMEEVKDNSRPIFEALGRLLVQAENQKMPWFSLWLVPAIMDFADLTEAEERSKAFANVIVKDLEVVDLQLAKEYRDAVRSTTSNVRHLTAGQDFRWTLHILLWVILGGIFAFFVYGGIVLLGRIRKMRGQTREISLRRITKRTRQDLDYEITKSRGGYITVPVIRRITGMVSVSEERKPRPLTLPGLTARYIKYVEELRQVLQQQKIIICIDELDKVSNVDDLRSILREIKGALYIPGCFYLLSISEDAMRTFEGRFVGERDIFESTFDEILTANRLDLKSCLSLSYKHFQAVGYDSNRPRLKVETAIAVCAVLSSGIPRELIRNLRDAMGQAGEIRYFQPALAWRTLFSRKVSELADRIMATDCLEEQRARMIRELQSLLSLSRYDTEQSRSVLRRIERQISHIRDARAALDNQSNQTDQTERRALDTWLKNWIELKVYCLVRLHVLSKPTLTPGPGRDTFEGLLGAYGMLPYCAEASEKHLQRLNIAHR